MEEEIDLLDLFMAFMKKKFWIIIAVIFGAFIGLIYTKFIVVPKYASSVNLILVKAGNGTAINQNQTYYLDSDDAITASDITLNQKLISTYSEIIKSRRIVNEVITNLNLKMNYSDVKNSISVSSVKDTDIIKVTITTEDAKLSKKIATELVDCFTKEVANIYNIQNVYIMDKAQLEETPVNISYGKNIVIFALIAGVIVCGIIFLNYYFDNTIKSQETITQITGLPVLATIPRLDKNAMTDSAYSSGLKGGKKNG